MLQKIICLFDKDCSNVYYKYIFNSIYEKLKIKYSDCEINHEQPENSTFDNGAPGYMCNFQIINPENNKTIVMSFSDRGDRLFEPNLGWGKYKKMQYIGGLGMYLTSNQIREIYDVEHIPFQYPLGYPDSYDYINEFRREYDPEKFIRKAVYIGSIYDSRIAVTNYMKNHPLVEIIDKIYTPRDYFEKMKDYRIGLSFNGNGEACLRDFEIMGLGIPLMRAELKTQFYNKLIPDYHYIKSWEPDEQAWYGFRGVDFKKMADNHIYLIEKYIDDYDTLKEFSNRGLQYFESYCYPDYMVDLFLKLIKLDALI
jgi:hypothetical protein